MDRWKLLRFSFTLIRIMLSLLSPGSAKIGEVETKTLGK